MSSTASLADHIQDRTTEFLQVWRDVVLRRDDIPDAEPLSSTEFNDHIPELLDRLAEALRGRGTAGAIAGAKHGRMRWRQGYDLGQIVLELGVLRDALTRASFRFARMHDLDLPTLESACSVINEVLSEATASAVETFQEIRDAEIRDALARAEERQAAAQDARLNVESERTKLRILLENLPAGVWVADASGVLVTTNREGERMQGFRAQPGDPPFNVRGSLGSHYRIFRPDGTPYGEAELPIARALDGEVVDREEIYWEVGGEIQIVTINAAPLHDPSGAIGGAVAVALDVTTRKRAEEQLRRQLDFTRAITDSMAEGLYALDKGGKLTFMNPAAERLLGWHQDELLGRVAHEVIHHLRPDGTPYPIEECPIHGILQTGQPLSGDECFRDRQGRRVVAAFSAAPILSEGRVVGAVISFRDIAERKRLEAGLAAAEAQFRSIAEQSPVMIWRAGTDGRCDWFNQTWCDFRGRAIGRELEADRTQAIHPDDRDRFRRVYQEAFERREVFELTYRLQRGDGQYRWIVDRGTPYRDRDGAFLGFLGSCVDISERIELEAILASEKDLAEEASRHKTQLLSALSHDARTPLNAVVLSAQLLESYMGKLNDPEVEQCLRTIRHSVRNVLDLLGDLLNLSKIDAGAMPAEPSRFTLGSVLVESLASIQTQAQVKGLEIRTEHGPGLDLVVETDRAKLKQILCNLLSNALRYTESGHILFATERTADELRISVEDTGIGIAPADQGRIFDEFATLNQPHRPVGEGTGLGLAICRRLASLLRGEIALTSEPDRGSRFTLVLPGDVVVADTAGGGAAQPAQPAAKPAAGEGAILIVEDHVTSRQTLAKVLRRRGYRILEAGNGHDALALMRVERPSAVLMDVNMPVMDGIEATRLLRADPELKDLPVFALTGDVSLLNRRRIGDAGVNGFLEKPVTLEALEEALASLRM